jgi:V/A-type H+-transporting ATPase subunit B
MIQLYADHRQTLEKRAMGFRMSAWDERLLRYGAGFEAQLMDLDVDLPLERALDVGWTLLASCFEPAQTGLPSDLIERHWPAAP